MGWRGEDGGGECRAVAGRGGGRMRGEGKRGGGR